MSSVNPDSFPFLPVPFLPRELILQEDAGGVLRLQSGVPLGPVAAHIPAIFKKQVALHPDRAWIKQRPAAGAGWRELSYGQAGAQVDAVTQWLLNLGQPGRSVMVLSGNSIEHAVLQLAAMQARMPYVPVTPAYALLSTDFTKLRAMVERVGPAVILVQEGRRFETALQALAPQGVQVVYVEDAPLAVQATPWADVLATPVGPEVAQSVAAITPDVVGKYLFTSGSTGIPKAVPVTQAMLCTSTAMHAHTVRHQEQAAPSVLLEWLPWSHVAGGTAIFNSVLDEGGTLYLDDGRPVPGEFERTLRNLRELSPTRFSSVPAGYAMLVDALERDEPLAANFFRHLRRLTSSGAKLPDTIYQRLQALSVRHLGHRMPFVAGYGSTETTAATMVVHWPDAPSGLVGLPQPGVHIKLVPLDDSRYEVRVKAPSVMSGYLQEPALTAAAFDDEGYYCMGDAVTFVDRSRPEEGLAFAGRVAEEFKLMSGIFVRVGALRVELINAAAPLVADAVIAGADQAWVGALVWLNPTAVRERFGDEALRSPATHSQLRQALQQAVARHNERHPASSMVIRRLLVQTEPASMDAGEITDKGYVNQRAVLARRAAEVARLYATPPEPDVIVVGPSQT